MRSRRTTALRKELSRLRLDALLVTSLRNIRYLTGFTGSNALCIVTTKGQYFVTDPRYAIQSRAEVRGWKRFITADSLAGEAVRQKLLARCRRLGFESSHLDYARYRSYKRQFGEQALIATEGIVEQLGIAKSVSEIARIRSAVAITERVFKEILKLIRPGVSELDLSAEISYRQRRYGAEKDAFDPIVASGIRSALPHARASRKKVKAGEGIILDFGCVVEGYHSDLTRTVFVENVSRKMKEIYNLVRKAQEHAIHATRSNMEARELDAVARETINNGGWGRHFVHSLGHGLGLDVHEAPRVSLLSRDTLVQGCVITIEPGVYVPNLGGVRIEDDVVVTKRGCDVLTRSSKELIIL
ncbi:MAG TPA: Xaa-Pro peptidase family protein [Bacteroidota bacterium]